ncbi:MAG: glycerophosphodiester phosphodiesterase [Alistipes sp.]|nr:glycerophosphodiester phosphodiesterase [Alistipes senegalensis]MCM1249922.1 glycerophosphodiester phosphodiesterase [Alistipes sp.]
MSLHLLVVALSSLIGGACVSDGPAVIAHRGYWTAPGSAQNSLAAFAKADSIGVFGAEFDVWLTADDGLIVNHDRVFRGTDIDMERSTLAEITAISLPNGEPIPTLDAYLALAAERPATRLVLEMKGLSSPGREELAARKIVEALHRYGVVGRTDIISFSLDACRFFRALLPDVPVYFLGGTLSPAALADMGLSGLDYHMDTLRAHPEWVEEAHALGLRVNVWTVDREEEMQEFIDLGVDFITTDRPELLQSLLSRRP